MTTPTNEDLLVIAHQRGLRTARAHYPALSGNPQQLAADLYPLDPEEREAYLAGYLCEGRRIKNRNR